LAWVTLFTALGWAAPSASVSDTLAILPLENNSITDRESYEPLEKGLSAMLITDLSQIGGSLKLIERSKIQPLFDEIALNLGGSVNEAGAVRAGMMLGAQNIAFGSFVVLGSNVRIDIRIIKVETSELVAAERVMGDSSDFMRLEQKLAGRIAAALEVAFLPDAAAGPSGMGAALLFSRGLDAMDRGDSAKASELLRECVAVDPTYRKQVDSIPGVDI